MEQAARESRGRLIAWLSARSRDVAAAEDALSEAFAAALEHWPASGIPEKPEAWLLTVARRRMIDVGRRSGRQAEAAPTLQILAEEAEDLAMQDRPFPDARLQLMFVCAHPAIDAAIRAPLMLQTVLGLDAARIASAFLVAPATMGQRLSRAKAKIRDAGIAFELPEAADMTPRLEPVLNAIYAAYGSGWDDSVGDRRRGDDLAREAIDLGRLLAGLLPAEPEAHGLLALMLHCEARRAARRDGSGEFVPLSEQDTARWSWPMLGEAETHLRQAGAAGRPGRFQWEAAIQSVHAGRAVSGRTDWATIVQLYEGLVRSSPTVGVLVGRAAAVCEARGATEGWEALAIVPADMVRSYRPYWATRAHIAARLGQTDEARESYVRAIGLSADEATRRFLARKLADLG